MVKAEDILADIEADRSVKYYKETIEGDLDLSKLNSLKDDEGRVRIPVSIEIKNSKVKGKVNFHSVVFEENVSFKSTNFVGIADLVGVQFDDNAEFRDAIFSSRANFTNARFNGKADFRNAEFGHDAYFQRHVKFGGYADFRGTMFGGDAHFGEAEFWGDVSFSWAKFSGDSYFLSAQFYKTLDLHKLKFGRLYISWNSIEDRLCYFYNKGNNANNNNYIDGPTHLALIKNFKIIEQFNDADDCYYIYRRESQRGKSWLDCTKFLDIIGWVSCGYGVKLKRIFGCVFGSILVFSVFYGIFSKYYGGIARDVPSTTTMAALNNSTLLLAFTTNNIRLPLSWWEPFYFSAMAFLGVTPEGLHPVSGLFKLAVMIEGILGYFLLALFVVVLARKLIR